MIRLFTSHYREVSPQRREELEKCLQRNFSLPWIDEIHLWLERIDSFAIEIAKLHTRRINRRPTYSDYMMWIAELAPSQADISIIVNSDIYFDGSLAALTNALKPSQCTAMSRWNVLPNGNSELFDRNDSQDAWVFKGPLRNVQADFPVGVPRCDNRLLYELKRAGYDVINPAFSVRAYHLHAGSRSEYNSETLEHFVESPYAYLWPHNLWSLPRTLWHNLRHPEARIGWRLDRRKISASLPARAIRKVLGSIWTKKTPVKQTK